MIEINLIPDVKQDLIRARRVRTTVVSGAIIVGIVSVGIVVLLAVYLYGIQTLRSTLADSAITDKSAKLKQVPDLANMLTIQSQLSNITEYHNQKNMDSRLFELLTMINPAKPNQVVFSQVRVDSAAGTIHIDGQATNGFVAADVLKKTIQATSFSYTDSDKTKTDTLTSSVTISNLSYGEDSTGAKVLRFSIDFEYNKALFARSSTNAVIVRPDRQNATDSFKYLPESIFGTRAVDVGGTK
ncbi:MAG: putative Fimbrial assembly family protein [Candidatus Saccharibacteria bacterium]|nr:putative Fimbrial assembly family protein [Candidatus Saccharibacteria bacterium]